MKFDIGHYREFRLPEWFDDGEGVLAKTLAEVWNRRYMDIYDRGGRGNPPWLPHPLGYLGLPFYLAKALTPNPSPRKGEGQ